MVVFTIALSYTASMINLRTFVIFTSFLIVTTSQSFADNACCTLSADAKTPYCILISKSTNSLTVCDKDGWVVSYDAVFGTGGLDDKMQMGDKKTPEGDFTISSKKEENDRWDRFLYIDYPTKDSQAKFNSRKKSGQISKSAKIGSGVGIHGTVKYQDYVVNNRQNWTDGCISLRNKDIESLYNLIPEGTKVTIVK